MINKDLQISQRIETKKTSKQIKVLIVLVNINKKQRIDCIGKQFINYLLSSYRRYLIHERFS